MMDATAHTQAVLLLTTWFTRPARDDPEPLSAAEWGRLASWLRDRQSSPEALLLGDLDQSLAGWQDRTVTMERLRLLLRRAGALALALEKWERAGLWVLTRASPEYPTRLKRLLRADSPPVLFGCGSARLLSQGGIAVVGSRDASAADLQFTTDLAREIAQQGFSLVSGGARGVDEAAMLGALESDGTAVGVLADSLLRTAVSTQYRRALMAGALVLVSPCSPEAGFNARNAMARNKYVYCLADAAIVVVASARKGGTWAGAVENLKGGWVPLWVRRSAVVTSGNALLAREGAHLLPEGPLDVRRLVASSEETSQAPALLPLAPAVSDDADQATSPEHGGGVHAPIGAGEKPLPSIGPPGSFYEFFLGRLRTVTAHRALTCEEMLTAFDVGRAQLSAWLKRAVDEGVARRSGRPARYQWQGPRAGQASLFDDER